MQCIFFGSLQNSIRFISWFIFTQQCRVSYALSDQKQIQVNACTRKYYYRDVVVDVLQLNQMNNNNSEKTL